MNNFEYEAIFYDLPDGSEPALTFLRSLDVKMRAKLERSILLLQSRSDIKASIFRIS